MRSPDSHATGFVKDPVQPLRYDGQETAEMIPFEAIGILRSFMPNSVRVLDVGCGTGSVTEIINRDKGNAVFGIEPDPTRAELARSRGIDVFCGTLTEEYFAGKEPFDIVIFADVLEHVADPAELLRLASIGLKSGGIVLVSVPNVAHWTIRLDLLLGRFNYTETGIMDATHLRWFTRKTIQHLLFSEGF